MTQLIEPIKNKLQEAFRSILPVNVIVLLLSFTIAPMPVDITLKFLMGSVFLVVGIAFFTIGAEIAMVPIGYQLGAYITKKRKLWFLIVMGAVIGFIIAVAEPGLRVLAEQVDTVPSVLLIVAVASGLGLLCAIAVLRIVFRIGLAKLLMALYAILFILAFFVPENFLPLSFDSGGASTGALTVPFLMTLGIGISSVRSDADAESDSFGLLALCTVGPIFAIMILGLVYAPDGSFHVAAIPSFYDTSELWLAFMRSIPATMLEVTSSIAPVALLFLVFQLLAFKLPRQQVNRIIYGLAYAFFGLIIFLTGVNIGFLPAANALGQVLAALTFNWVIIPITMVVGYFIISAEPAVYVLTTQVEEITSGAITPRALGVSLSIGVSLSTGLSMMRVLYSIPLIWILLPGYLIAAGLSFFVPKLFTAIAFDSGGVATGAMASTFLLPLAIGTSAALGGNILVDAFGVIAMIAMTPLITIQILGLYYKLKSQESTEAEESSDKDEDSEIIDMETD